MTAGRRLAKLEGALSPSAAILLWLEEAHAFGDLDAYTAWLLDQPYAAWPLVKLPRQVGDAALEANRGRPRHEDLRLANDAVREVFFAFELGLRINVTTHEQIERDALLCAVLTQRLGVISLAQELERVTGEPQREADLGPWQELVAVRVAELRAIEEARTTVEQRYLAGRTALFPAIARAWDERRRETEELPDLGNRLAGLNRSPARHGAPAGEDGPTTLAPALTR